VGTEVVPIGSLTPDPANVRVHEDENLQAVEASLKRFGPGRSIVVDGRGIVVAGNATIDRAKATGITEVLIVDPEPGQLVAVRRKDWSPSEATAYAIVDNRAAELASWDAEALTRQADALVEEGIPLEALGFTREALDELVRGVGDEDPAGGDGGGEKSDGSLLDLVSVVVGEPRTPVNRGDVWLLGKHVLCCHHVLTEWAAYVPYLDSPDAVLAPYPGVFLVFSLKARERKYVLVQPDPYIAGHIIDQWLNLNGVGSAGRIVDGSKADGRDVHGTRPDAE
jgi:hypothetical protein